MTWKNFNNTFWSRIFLVSIPRIDVQNIHGIRALFMYDYQMFFQYDFSKKLNSGVQYFLSQYSYLPSDTITILDTPRSSMILSYFYAVFSIARVHFGMGSTGKSLARWRTRRWDTFVQRVILKNNHKIFPPMGAKIFGMKLLYFYRMFLTIDSIKIWSIESRP